MTIAKKFHLYALIAVILGNVGLSAAQTRDSYFTLTEDSAGRGEARLVTPAEKLKFVNGGVLSGGENEPVTFLLPGWNGSSGSISYWIQPVDWTSDTEKSVVFYQPSDTDAKGGSFLFYKYSQAKGLWFLGTMPENGKSQIQIYFKNEDVLRDFKPGKWNHLGFVWRRGEFAKAYVNGVCVGQMKGEFFSPESFSKFALGRSGKLYAQSVIRDVHISRHAITDEEMQNRYSPVKLDFSGETLLPFAEVNVAPKQDGYIGETEYSSVIPGLVEAESTSPGWEQGVVHTAIDSEFIYLAASLKLPANYIPSSLTSRRDDPRQESKGDLFVLLVQPGQEKYSKHIKAAYLTVAPNGNLYDAQEEVDWERRSCQRNPEWDSGAICASRIVGGNWNVELKLPRGQFQIPQGSPFRISLGFKLGSSRIALVPHPVWFDHYQAFVSCTESPIGCKADWKGLSYGITAGEFVIENKTADKFPVEISAAFSSPTIKKTASGMVVEQMIDQEIHVESEGVLWEDKKEFTLEANSSGSVRFGHQLAQPGSYLLQEKVMIGSQTVLSRRIPFSYYPPLTIQLHPIPSKDSIRMKYNCSGISGKERKKLYIDVRFVKDSHTVMKRRHVVSESGTDIFSMSQLPPGTYDVQADLVREDGDVIGMAKTSFYKREIESWLKNPIGLEALNGDWVPEPWVALQREGQTVSLWGRRHDYNGQAIIKQIYSQERELLSGEVSARYLFGQNENILPVKKLSFSEEQSGRIKISQWGGDKKYDLAISQEIEFDGCNLISVRITPKFPSRVNQLWIEIPFKKPQYQYVKAADHRSYVLGEVQGGSWTDFPMFWVGDDDIGCFVFAESFRGWQSNSQKPRLTFTKTGDNYVLKLLVVNEAVVLDKSFEFTFGIQAGPVKPFFDGWRDIRPQGWGWKPQPVNLFMVDPRNWSTTYSRPVPLNWQRVTDMANQVHKDGQLVYPYLTPFSISTYDIIRRDTPVYQWADTLPESATTYKKKDSRPVEEYWYYAEDWDLVPRRITGDGTDRETTEMAYVDPDSSWADYFVGSVYEIMKRTDIDGLYFDLPYPKENRNKAKNLVYTTPDGVQEGTFQYLAARNLYKRLYWVFEQLRGPQRKPYILGHSGRYFFPLSSFWDVEFHGEEVKPSIPFEFTQLYLQNTLSGAPAAAPASPDAPRSYDSLAFRSSYGKQFGMPQMLLPQYGHKIKTPGPELSREILSFTFLHDVYLWPAYINDSVVYKFWDQVNIPFGMKDTEFYGYWENGIISQPDCVRVSYYKKKNTSQYLLAAANYSSKPVNAIIKLPPSMKNISSATNMETKQMVSIDSSLQVEIPSHDLQVFFIGSSDAE